MKASLSVLFLVVIMTAPATTFRFYRHKITVTRDPCARFECQNGGTCTAPADAPFCVCPSGFSGKRCENKDVVKPGSCPVIKPGSIGICGGTFCTRDSGCPGNAKCCRSACGGNLCTSVLVPVPTTPPPENRCGSCPHGHTCVDRPLKCPVGKVCLQALVPTCVPNSCLDCDDATQRCHRVGTVCAGCVAGGECPNPACWDRFQCVSKDPCGGCPDDQVCKDTGIVCATFPCDTHKCVPKDKCGGCAPGYRCETVFPPCPPPSPDCVNDPECIGSYCKQSGHTCRPEFSIFSLG